MGKLIKSNRENQNSIEKKISNDNEIAKLKRIEST